MGRAFGILLLSGFVFVTPIAFLHGQVQPDQKPLAFEVASIYALVVARPNVIRPTTTDCRATPDKCNIQSTAGHFSAVALNMNNMLSVLSNAVERVVVDRTGLQGSYDIDIDWAAEPGSDKPSIFTAVQEQLGLKLESTRAPVDVFVIDHVERPIPD